YDVDLARGGLLAEARAVDDGGQQHDGHHARVLQAELRGDRRPRFVRRTGCQVDEATEQDDQETHERGATKPDIGGQWPGNLAPRQPSPTEAPERPVAKEPREGDEERRRARDAE